LDSDISSVSSPVVKTFFNQSFIHSIFEAFFESSSTHPLVMAAVDFSSGSTATGICGGGPGGGGGKLPGGQALGKGHYSTNESLPCVFVRRRRKLALRMQASLDVTST
jgi:hypothetical protein